MNKTTLEHFLRYFPNENIDDFDTIYFTQGGKNDFAFILVKGAMEDIKVFTHGNYDEESLERRLFGLISTYGTLSTDEIFYPMINNQDTDFMVRDELIYSHKFHVSETLRTSIFICMLLVFETLTIFLLHLFGISTTYLFLIIIICLIVDSVLFFIFKPHSLRKEGEKW